ncbi:hypothetical protein C8R46DRAFT_1186794 [Mycena filopes]|nr:hypothetical protein C8R46DRAFT_1186794 [Mycena filopes]
MSHLAPTVRIAVSDTTHTLFTAAGISIVWDASKATLVKLAQDQAGGVVVKETTALTFDGEEIEDIATLNDEVFLLTRRPTGDEWTRPWKRRGNVAINSDPYFEDKRPVFVFTDPDTIAREMGFRDGQEELEHLATRRDQQDGSEMDEDADERRVENLATYGEPAEPGMDEYEGDERNEHSLVVEPQSQGQRALTVCLRNENFHDIAVYDANILQDLALNPPSGELAHNGLEDLIVDFKERPSHEDEPFVLAWDGGVIVCVVFRATHMIEREGVDETPRVCSNFDSTKSTRRVWHAYHVMGKCPRWLVPASAFQSTPIRFDVETSNCGGSWKRRWRLGNPVNAVPLRSELLHYNIVLALGYFGHSDLPADAARGSVQAAPSDASYSPSAVQFSVDASSYSRGCTHTLLMPRASSRRTGRTPTSSSP